MHFIISEFVHGEAGASRLPRIFLPFSFSAQAHFIGVRPVLWASLRFASRIILGGPALKPAPNPIAQFRPMKFLCQRVVQD
jgi:hypothetical protein